MGEGGVQGAGGGGGWREGGGKGGRGRAREHLSVRNIVVHATDGSFSPPTDELELCGSRSLL